MAAEVLLSLSSPIVSCPRPPTPPTPPTPPQRPSPPPCPPHTYTKLSSESTNQMALKFVPGLEKVPKRAKAKAEPEPQMSKNGYCKFVCLVPPPTGASSPRPTKMPRLDPMELMLIDLTKVPQEPLPFITEEPANSKEERRFQRKALDALLRWRKRTFEKYKSSNAPIKHNENSILPCFVANKLSSVYRTVRTVDAVKEFAALNRWCPVGDESKCYTQVAQLLDKINKGHDARAEAKSSVVSIEDSVSSSQVDSEEGSVKCQHSEGSTPIDKTPRVKEPTLCEGDIQEVFDALLKWRKDAYEMWHKGETCQGESENSILPLDVARKLSDKFTEVRNVEDVKVFARVHSWVPSGDATKWYEEIAQLLNSICENMETRRHNLGINNNSSSGNTDRHSPLADSSATVHNGNDDANDRQINDNHPMTPNRASKEMNFSIIRLKTEQNGPAMSFIISGRKGGNNIDGSKFKDGSGDKDSVKDKDTCNRENEDYKQPSEDAGLENSSTKLFDNSIHGHQPIWKIASYQGGAKQDHSFDNGIQPVWRVMPSLNASDTNTCSSSSSSSSSGQHGNQPVWNIVSYHDAQKAHGCKDNK
ncbi:hypothetical protein BGZ94_004868 [Podila epigama]|nr:hypothetical protein BGZ94_004868 [Podila epigama]